MRVAVGDLTIGYDFEGPEGAPIVALGHCYCSDRTLWKHQREALLDAGYRVLAADARGHGETPAPPLPYGLADMADDLAGLLDVLAIERVHLCGISMSGMVAQWFAIRHPHRLRSLVLANTSSAYSAEQRAGWADRMQVLERQGPEALLDGAMSRWFTEESLTADVHGVQLIRQGFLDMAPDVRLATMGNIASVQTTERLSEITAPTLVITGELDLATPHEAGLVIQAQIAGAELVCLEGASHISPCERPEGFNAALLDFLGRQPR